MRHYGVLFCLFSLSGCASFQINQNYNEFRGIKNCAMSENVVQGWRNGRHTFLSGLDMKFNFQSEKNIKTHAINYTLEISTRTDSEFKDDSHMLISLDDGSVFKLVADWANTSATPYTSTTPGNYNADTNIYTEGSTQTTYFYSSKVSYSIPPQVMNKMSRANQIMFKIEPQSAGSIMGSFTPKNIKNMQAFKAACM